MRAWRLAGSGKLGHEGLMTDLQILRRYAAGRQLETGFEFNPMPGSRGVSLDPVSRATWYRKAKPADETAVSETPVKPWVAAGVSRASWYRHHRG